MCNQLNLTMIDVFPKRNKDRKNLIKKTVTA